MYPEPLYLPAGDKALVVELGDTISPKLNRKVRDLTLAIEKEQIPGLLDLVPTYRSLLIYYDPMDTSISELETNIKRLDADLGCQQMEKPHVVHVPTLYGKEYGPDVHIVAKHGGLSEDDVIRIHSSTDYLVYMMGFSPGFPYLGGLDKQLHTPRLKTPRTTIPAGSVGIAESQTGVYPVASPGGWQLIGRTPLRLFNPDTEPPAILKAGEYVRFVPLDTEKEYSDIERQVENGTYQVIMENAQ